MMQVALSSYKIVGLSLIDDNPQFSQICCITDLSQTHSWLASWIAIISEWFEEVADNVCLIDLHDMAVLP